MMAVTRCINTTMWFDRDLLQAWRQASGYTWKHLSKASDIRPDTLAGWGNGKTNPNMYQLLKLESVSHIPIAGWIAGKDENVKARETVNDMLRLLGDCPWL